MPQAPLVPFGIRCWLLAGLVGLAGIAAAADQVLVQHSDVARLAEAMRDSDATSRWLFADTLLQVAVEAYDAELASARGEPVSGAARQAKLRRWLGAARAVRDGLVAARLRLSEGAPLEIHVDELGEVFLFIGGRPYAFSAPRPVREHALQAALVARFCAVGDCAALDRRGRGAARLPGFGGSWTIDQHAPPAYRVDGVARCDFADLGHRRAKVDRCLAVAADVGALRAALLRARAIGYELDWAVVRRVPTRSGNQAVVAINAAGDFVRLSLPVLARLDRTRWSAVVDDLRRSLREPAHEVRVDWIDEAWPTAPPGADR